MILLERDRATLRDVVLLSRVCNKSFFNWLMFNLVVTKHYCIRVWNLTFTMAYSASMEIARLRMIESRKVQNKQTARNCTHNFILQLSSFAGTMYVCKWRLIVNKHSHTHCIQHCSGCWKSVNFYTECSVMPAEDATDKRLTAFSYMQCCRPTCS